MLQRLLEWFSQERAYVDLPAEERLRLAAAVILLEAATVDEEFSPEECRRVLDALQNHFHLSNEDAENLLVAAQEKQSQNNALWRCTREINEQCDLAEKLSVLEETWRVIYADGTLEAHEDYFIHKLANLLNLTHPQLIEAKMRVLGDQRQK